MYDAKILVIIESSDEFEEIAKAQIDGVIFKNLILNLCEFYFFSFSYLYILHVVVIVFLVIPL